MNLKLFPTVLDSTRVLFALLTPSFDFIYVNRAYVKAAEKAPSFFLGRNYFALYPDEENQRIFEEVTATGQPTPISGEPSLYPSHPERALTFWGWTLTPISDSSGRVTYLLLSLVDVTGRKEVEQPLCDSRAQCAAFLDDRADLICRIRGDGTIVFVNEAYCRQFHLEPAGLADKNIYDLVPAEERNRLQGHLSRFQQHRKSAMTENMVLGPEGRMRWLQWANQAFFDAADQLQEFQTVGRDITVLKQLEVALKRALKEVRDEHTKVEAILNGLGDAVQIVDADFRIIFQNRISLDLFGNHEGKYCYQKIFGKKSVCKNCPVALVFADGQQHTVEKQFERDGRSFYFEVKCSPLWDADGNITGVIEDWRDISARKVSERALKELHGTLEQKVGERTADLEKTIRQLQHEVKERVVVQKELAKKREAFKDVNTAMSVLLERYKQGRGELKEKIEENIKSAILPHVHELGLMLEGDKKKDLLAAIESNLLNITSGFSKKLSSHFIGLTGRELQIAQLVREGLTNKGIAELLNVSEGTVKTHRHKIRAKLGINNQQMNLRSYLLSLEDD